MELGLLQREVAGRLGADESMVGYWERNRRSPAIRYVPRIIAFLGYAPLASGSSLADRLLTYRRINGLSQVKLASLIGVHEGTLRKWEGKRSKPNKEHRIGLETLLGS